MNSDTLRKAVELAKGWSISANGCITLPNGGEDWYVDWPNIYLSDYPDGGWKVITDALAAQLVRQYHERHPEDRLLYEDDVMEVIGYVVANY